MRKKLMAGAVAGFLLVGASDVMARVVDAWIVVGLQSASGTVDVEGADLCMQAVLRLTQQGFSFVATTELEPRLAALFFLKEDQQDAVTLFCAANIFTIRQRTWLEKTRFSR